MTIKPFRSGAEAVDALPAVMAIGAFSWKLEKWHPSEATAASRYGECASYQLIIRVRADMPEAQKAADTLLHEALHGIFFVYGVRDEDGEERTVGMLARALTALHRHNPWLGPWLARCLPG